MFEQGNILYFTPFYFKNGNTAKNKYFIVLSSKNDNTILASLPTSKDHIPSINEKDTGCIELPEANFNCFVFQPTQILTECGKKMPRTTYVYGEELGTYKTDTLEEVYRLQGVHYEIIGKMQAKLFQELINCLKNSKTVARKYKRMI